MPGKKRRQKVRCAMLLVSLLCLPITLNYFSPVLSVAGAAEGIVSGSLALFILLFAVSLLLGRAFCGWLCPVSGFQEVCSGITDRKAANRGNWIRFVIWIPWVGAIAVFILLYGKTPTVHLLYQTDEVYSLEEANNYVVLFSLYAVLMVLVLAVGTRSFCHHVCWISPFMVIGRRARNVFRWPSLRLKADKKRCIECGRCASVCPMGLGVLQMTREENMENAECILCGGCADDCPKEAIRFSFSRG
jgi:polyferredoxin